jgi:hypothetical protein
MKKRLLSSLAFAVLSPLAQARDQGAGIALDQLPASTQTYIMESLRASRGAHPDAHAALEALAVELPSADATKRGRFVPTGRSFMALAKVTPWPLVEALTTVDHRQAAWTDTAETAWMVGLLESLGKVADPKLAPVYEAILQQGSSDRHVLRAAAFARARLSDKAGATFLMEVVRRAGPMREGVIAGLGQCRRADMAHFLAQLAATETDREVVASVIDALSDIGNAWVWPVLHPAARGDEVEVRSVAATALVKLVASPDFRIAELATNAALVVDSPDTAQLIVAQRVASPGAAEALNRLEGRLNRRILETPIR